MIKSKSIADMNKASIEIKKEIDEAIDKYKKWNGDGAAEAGKVLKEIKKEIDKTDREVREAAESGDLEGADDTAGRYLEIYSRILKIFKKYPGPWKPSKFKTSWDFIDQKLMTRGEARSDILQYNLFDDLGDPSEWERVEGDNDLWINELTGRGGEWRLINSLFQIIEDAKTSRSSEAKYGISVLQNYDIDNLRNEGVHYLRVKKKVLYKTYTGNDHPSGQEIKLVNKTLRNLEKKHIRVFWQKEKIVKGEKRYDLIEINEPLIKLARLHKDINEAERSGVLKEGEVLDKTELIIKFNPILIDQLETRYLLYTRDIAPRIAEAAGGPKKVTGAMTQLTDYLIRAITTQKKRGEPVHGVYTDTLINKLGLSGVRKKDTARASERLSDAIRVTKSLGLHTGTRKKTGKDGREKIEFTLNLDY